MMKNKETPDILEVIDIKFMQNIQDFFAKTMNVTLLSIYEKNWLTEPSNNTDFCRKYTRRSKLGYKNCELCHQKIEETVKKEGKPIITNCPIGLTIFAVPVFIGEKYFACVLGGQILTQPPDEQHFRNIAKMLNINEEEYIKEMENIKILPLEVIKSIMDLLYLVTNSITALSYTNFQLRKSGNNYEIPRNLTLEEWFLNKYGNTTRPISAREYEVLRLIVSGKSNTEVAKELFISTHTVKAHVSSLLEKFSVKDRVQLAVKVTKEGLI